MALSCTSTFLECKRHSWTTSISMFICPKASFLTSSLSSNCNYHKINTRFSKTFLLFQDLILFHSNIHPEKLLMSKSFEPIWGALSSGVFSIFLFYCWEIDTSNEFISVILWKRYFIYSPKTSWWFILFCGVLFTSTRPKTADFCSVHWVSDFQVSFCRISFLLLTISFPNLP